MKTGFSLIGALVALLVLSFVAAGLFMRLNEVATANGKFAKQLDDAIALDDLNRMTLHKNSCKSLLQNQLLSSTIQGIVPTTLNIGSTSTPDIRQVKLQTVDVQSGSYLLFRVLLKSSGSPVEQSSTSILAQVDSSYKILDCLKYSPVPPFVPGLCATPGMVMKGINSDGSFQCI